MFGLKQKERQRMKLRLPFLLLYLLRYKAVLWLLFSQRLNAVLYSTLLYSTLLYSTLLYSTLLYSTLIT